MINKADGHETYKLVYSAPVPPTEIRGRVGGRAKKLPGKNGRKRDIVLDDERGKMTPGKLAYAQIRINNPRIRGKEAYKMVMGEDVPDEKALAESKRLDKDKAVLRYLRDYSEASQRALIEVAETSKEFSKLGNAAGAQYASVAEKAFNSIIDRVHGKAKQVVDVNNTTLNISIDLSGEEAEEEERPFIEAET